MYKRGRRTDGQTEDGHRMTAYAALMHSIARQKPFKIKNVQNVDLEFDIFHFQYLYVKISFNTI